MGHSFASRSSAMRSRSSRDEPSCCCGPVDEDDGPVRERDKSLANLQAERSGCPKDIQLGLGINLRASQTSQFSGLSSVGKSPSSVQYERRAA